MSDSAPSRTDESAGTGAILAGIVLILLLVLLLLGYMNSNGSGTQASAGAEMTAQSGAVRMPTATPTPAIVDLQGTEQGAAVLLPGRRVASISPDGRGTRVYAVPSRSGLVMDLYRDGAAFVVLDPAARAESYPVEAEGFTWYRVRASDGLVGWVVVDRLVPLE